MQKINNEKLYFTYTTSVFCNILNRTNVTLTASHDTATSFDFSPSIVNVLPVPVWPYAKTVQL